MAEQPRLVPVHLVGVPVRLRARSLEHGQELLRELALVRLGADATGATSAPDRLLSLADELQSTYGAIAAGFTAAMDAAADDGSEFVDVTYSVPDDLQPFLERVVTTLEDVERFARDGRYLLTLAAPDDVTAYRRWMFGELDRQISGGAPIPWPRAHDDEAQPATREDQPANSLPRAGVQVPDV